jgi:hypothetical protein
MLQISAYQAVPSWVDAGAISGLEVEEVMEVNKEENDNADADELVTKQEATLKCNLHEALKASIWDIIRSGFDTKTTTAAAEVSGATMAYAANTTEAGKFYAITGQNATGAKQTISGITNPVGTPLVEGTDYIQAKNEAGVWGLVFIAGSDYDATEIITVTYTYTPAASVTYKSGDKTVLPWFMCKVITKNDGSAYTTTLYKCKVKIGKKWTYPKDDDTDRRVKVPLEIIAKPDATYNSSLLYETVQTGGM